MVLRDKHRAAEPNCPAMASEQPLKKKQRTQPPDLLCDGGGFPDELPAPRSEDAVDCAAVPAEGATVEGLHQIAGGPPCAPSTSQMPNGIHNPHFPFSVQTLDGISAYNPSTDAHVKDGDVHENALFHYIDFYQKQLINQCLCSLSEEYLIAPFNCRLNIADWPPDKILLFLSHLQLMFDVYLKQNYKGSICTKLKDACDMLVRNEHDWLGEIIHLADHYDKFVNFTACRVVSSFLIVAKDNIDQEWLQKIVDNVYLFDTFNFINVNKINFSLDVIKRVVEWKDFDQHPLEDSAYINSSNPIRQEQSDHSRPGSSRQDTSAMSPNNSDSNNSHSSLQNAFSHLVASDRISTDMPSNSSFSSQETYYPNHSVASQPSPASETNRTYYSLSDLNPLNAIENAQNCEIISMTDSESFDTSHVKCLTIRCLERHWPPLIQTVKELITRYLNIANSENCILSFLSLWENIISVKANLSVIDTKPFYMDFQSFVELLRYTNLPSLIYTQLLSLFNEVLCYGSTLALQDMLPEETCTLAHSIVRFVKDFRLLNNIRLSHNEGGFNFIGGNGSSMLSYSLDSRFDYGNVQQEQEPQNSIVSRESSSNVLSRNRMSLLRNETNKTMLQKMVLLVLKSVAVTVKEMRCDSSDSSIDSSDYNAIQDMQMVERSIRDVLKKLDAFLKGTLNFLPDTPFTKILIHLFSDQDDYLIESMVCTLDITIGIVYRNSVFPDLIPMLNPTASFIAFLEIVTHDSSVLLSYLVSNETCFLLYLLRFLKYVRKNWSKFVVSCREVGLGSRGLDETMSVLIRLRHQISRLVADALFPYNISPVLKLLQVCENLYEGNELS